LLLYRQMYDGKTFKIAVLVSVLIHSALFFSIPNLSFFPSRKSLENLKITYYKIKQEPKPKTIARKKTEPVAEKLPEIKKEEMLRPPKPAKEEVKKVERETRHIKPVEKKEEKKFEAVVKEEKDDARKATYISYYRAVREKIKRYADRNYLRNRRLGEGEVFLSFVVASSGELLQVKVVTGRSVDDPLLRNIGMNSIRDANPFPSFPKGMSQYQITFNVIIAFEHR